MTLSNSIDHFYKLGLFGDFYWNSLHHMLRCGWLYVEGDDDFNVTVTKSDISGKKFQLPLYEIDLLDYLIAAVHAYKDNLEINDVPRELRPATYKQYMEQTKIKGVPGMTTFQNKVYMFGEHYEDITATCYVSVCDLPEHARCEINSYRDALLRLQTRYDLSMFYTNDEVTFDDMFSRVESHHARISEKCDEIGRVKRSTEKRNRVGVAQM